MSVDRTRYILRTLSVTTFLRLVILFLITMAFHAFAQTAGSLAGVLTDESGSVISGATVTAKSKNTGATQAIKTNESGVFRFPVLAPGDYEVKFSMDNFKQTITTATVVVSETSTLNASLAVGENNEVINVEGGAGNSPLLQADTSTLGRVVDEKQVAEMPLSTRNFTQLMTLSPGTSSSVNDAGALGRGTQTIYANGARAVSNSLTIDGIDAINIHSNSLAENSVSSNGVAIPSPEAVQEFKVQTSLYDAQYGRNAGANTALVTKSGTSHFHGSVYEFFRNDALNANTYFFKQNGTKRAVLKQNQFGASLGGPLPWHNFFFGSYQGTRQVNGLSASKTLSLPSGLYNSTRSAADLGAKYAGVAASNGTLTVAKDGSNISPTALALLNYKFANGQYAIPSPTSAESKNNYSVSLPSRYTEDQFVLNLDHQFGEKNHFSVKGFLTNQPQFKAFATATVPGFGQTQDFKTREFNFSDVHIFSPNVVNEAHAGLNRIMGNLSSENTIDIANIGMTRFNYSVFNNIPAIAVSGSNGTFTLGYSVDGNQGGRQNTFAYTDTVSYTHGNHSFRIGAELRRYQDNYYTYNRTLGTITVYSFVDFLLGRPAGPVADGGNGNSSVGALKSSSVATNIGIRNDRLTDYTVFFQDDWKPMRHLTLNLGLRWDRFGSGVDRGGRNGNFDPSLYSAPLPGSSTSAGFVQSANATKLLPGMPAVNPRLLKHELWKNFSPRVGFSYQLSGKAVLRGGYGIFFDRLSNQLSLRTALAPPNYIKSDLSDSSAGSYSLSNPFPNLPLPSALPVTPLLPYPTNTGATLLATNAVNTEMNMPYLHQFVLNVQYAAAKNTVVEVGYVGTKGVKLPTQIYLNQARLASADEPINGVTTNTVSNINLRVPYLGMSSNGLTYLTTNADSNYQSAQVSVTQRLAHGLQFLAAYTYSHSIDDSSGDSGSVFVNPSGDQLNLHQATGSSDFDRRHRFVVNYIYNLPFLSFGFIPRNGLTTEVLGGWQVSGVTTLQAGTPFTITDSNAASLYGTSTSRGFEAVGRTTASAAKSGSVTDRITGYFDTSAFVAQKSSTPTGYGDSPRNVLVGPGQANWDFSTIKDFPIYNTMRLQFRSEFFNVFNHSNFANPGSAASSLSTFGVISSTVGNPRVIQFAGKILF